jgi:glycosyltransferase involved in cell wall biosynthesis
VRIAQVAFRFDAPGGVETNVRAVAQGLTRAGEHVEIFASDLYDESSWERRTDFPPVVQGITVHRYPVYKRLIPHLTLPLLPGLVQGLADYAPDVLHAHSHRYGHVLESAAVAQRREIPLVVSTHYHPADRGEPPFKRALLRVQDVGFGATAYRIARALVVETQFEADLVAEFAPRDRIHVIPPGIDLEAWDQGTPEQVPGLPDHYFLYAGRIASNKGLPTLFRALARIPSEHRWPLVIMGRDWGEGRHLEALAGELGMTSSIHWLGHVPEAQRHRAIFFGAGAVVLPSEYEAFGLVLLEAMAAQVPIVASAVGGVPEVLENGRCGRLVPYGDVEAWTRALSEIMVDVAAQQEYRRRGRERVKDLTWAHSVERLRALYRSVTSAA